MSSKASQMHFDFALILVKGAKEAWGIGLIGQRLPSRNPVHHTRSKVASSTLSSWNNENQPVKASISGKNKTRGNCDAKT